MFSIVLYSSRYILFFFITTQSKEKRGINRIKGKPGRYANAVIFLGGGGRSCGAYQLKA
jgi:hypothetical protein